MVLLLSAVLLVLGGAYLTVSMTDRAIASNEADGAVAFNLAEAGIEHAIAELPDQNADALLTGGGVLFNNLSLGNGTYTTTIANNVSATGIVPADAGGASDDTDGFLVVTSEGRFRQARRVIRVIVAGGAGSGGLFDYVLYGRDEVKGSGGGAVTGKVHSNGNVKNGGFSIDGDASAGGVVEDHAGVTGTATDGAAPVFLPDIPCPAIPYGPAPVGPDVDFDPVSGVFKTGDDVVFPAGTYFFSEFVKTGGDKSIYVNAGDNVQIYISGKFSASGGGMHNPNPRADMMQFWACDGNTSDWSFTGGDSSRFTIYAPGSKISLTGGGDKIGAFIGKQISMSGGATVTYDSGLAAGPGGYTTVQGTWTEVW